MATGYKINTTNTEAISYTTEETGYTVLGGIRLEGLDRLENPENLTIIFRLGQTTK